MQKFTIYGERHSGTNFLEKVISENFRLEITWDFGWKHFGIGHRDADILEKQDIIILGIARNPYDWIGGMNSIPHHVRPNNSKNVRCLISKQWCSIFDNLQIHKHRFGQEIMLDRDWRTNKRYQNIFAMRANKLSYMKYDLPKLTPNYYLMTYERLCSNFNQVLKEISDKFNLKKYESKIQVGDQRKYTFDKPIVDIINAGLNWDVENDYGYYTEGRSRIKNG